MVIYVGQEECVETSQIETHLNLKQWVKYKNSWIYA